MTEPASRTNRHSPWVDWLFYLLLFASTACLFLLPVVPTGDGPMHVYYARILGDLSAHDPVYTPFYAIRHLVQPYCLHYFFLLAVEHLTSSAMAEKLFVAVIFLNFGLGLRFFAGKLGTSGSVVSLFVVPLLYCWALGGGFLNFLFAVGTMFWALGFSLVFTREAYRQEARHPRIGLSGFIAALVLLLLSHPIPLMILIVVLFGDFALQAVSRRADMGRTWLRSAWRQLLVLALACVAFLIPMAIADKARVHTLWTDFYPKGELIKDLVLGRRLGLFAGHSPLSSIVRVGELLVVPCSAALGFWGLARRVRRGELAASDRILLTGLVYLLATLAFPLRVNGSYYFAQRMWIVLWPLLLATAAKVRFSPRATRGLAAGAVLLVGANLALVVTVLRPIARQQATVAGVRLPFGESGIFLQPSTSVRGAGVLTSYPVDYWYGARAFEASHAVLLNSPWLDLTILPLKRHAHSGLYGAPLSTEALEEPDTLMQILSESGAQRSALLAQAHFILFADPLELHPNPVAELAPVTGSDGAWTCTHGAFWALCRRGEPLSTQAQ